MVEGTSHRLKLNDAAYEIFKRMYEQRQQERTGRRQDNPFTGVLLALGELKGGIDPAGADEHWKTARTALQRINDGFAGTGIQTLFIGAAIVADMANEIWAMLQEKPSTRSSAKEMGPGAHQQQPNELTARQRVFKALLQAKMEEEMEMLNNLNSPTIN